jgi:hypothetical protein
VLLMRLARRHVKQPQHVAPKPAIVRRVRIFGLVAVCVVLAVIGDPIEHGAFAGQAADEGDQPPQWSVCLETGVRDHPVKAETDANAASQPVQGEHEHHGLPREKNGAASTPMCITPIQNTTGQLMYGRLWPRSGRVAFDRPSSRFAGELPVADGAFLVDP